MKKQNKAYRVVTFLNREELDFLDGLVKDIYFSKGLNIPRQKMIECIIDAFKEEREKNKEDVEKELTEKFKKAEDK
ncbi:MAG: hypothetical protein HQ558_05655 [Candidatus Omnitrophica bacterium]|nr:hypothetical protein [Candidatus Omnitrophota bacterium]